MVDSRGIIVPNCVKRTQRLLKNYNKYEINKNCRCPRPQSEEYFG